MAVVEQDPPDPDTFGSLLGALGANSFALSFVFGAVVIALFASKRMGELIAPPKGDEFDFTRTMPLSLIVGRDLYYKALFFYMVLLEFVYLFLCTARPMVAALTTASIEKYDNTSWPLGAALLVVGILPSTPVVTQVETAIRRFAHNLADIPADFYNRVAAISNERLEDLVTRNAAYQTEASYYWRTYHLVALSGFNKDECQTAARRVLAVFLFSRWTLYEAQSIWTASELTNYSEILADLRPKNEQLKAEIEDLLAKSEQLAIVQAVLLQNASFELQSGSVDDDKFITLHQQLTTTLAQMGSTQRSITPSDKIAYDELTLLWEKKFVECRTAARRLIVLFAIIVKNDGQLLRELDRPENRQPAMSRIYLSAAVKDEVLKPLLEMLKRDSAVAQPWFNSILLSSMFGFLVCCVASSSARIAFNAFIEWRAGGCCQFDNFQDDVFKGLSTSIEYSTSFMFATLTALYIRSERLKNGSWYEFYSFNTIPTGMYIGIFLASGIAAFLPSTVNYVLYYVSIDNLSEILNRGPGGLALILFKRFVFSLVWGGIAVFLCTLADLLESNEPLNLRKTYLFLALGVGIVSAFIYVLGGIFPNVVYFWDLFVGALAVSYVGVRLFLRSFAARIAPRIRGIQDERAQARVQALEHGRVHTVPEDGVVDPIVP